ncbi:hypothetical protein DWG18_00010 [Lysobacter sp. TY2-98]|uniref:hypothetical protein n=1 Tax=Lysobacter sp. TY2-98 TaxID=2290922 RepID=UPI000E208F16|nr:hypothetical protein [Lysobacter sp. TY2-98]AXK70831.1 hypothetical protein DWG18_00010 [Lysobacter sp. TY2-98]
MSAVPADASPMSDAKITSHDLCVALKLAHPGDEFVTVFEVREATGSVHGSRADAVVMSLHASRGFELTGFEFKCARGDWLAELKNPSKADRIARFCDRWCVFAAPGVVKESELPTGWGLWELRAGGIHRRVVPATREPEPMPRAFLASFMRARAKFDADELAALASHHRREFERQHRARDEASDGDPSLRRDRQRVNEGLRKLEEIRRVTGIDLGDYTPSKRWVERMRLADSPRLEHALKLLRDVYADEELKRRIDVAMRSDED